MSNLQKQFTLPKICNSTPKLRFFFYFKVYAALLYQRLPSTARQFLRRVLVSSQYTLKIHSTSKLQKQSTLLKIRNSTPKLWYFNSTQTLQIINTHTSNNKLLNKLLNINHNHNSTNPKFLKLKLHIIFRSTIID